MTEYIKNVINDSEFKVFPISMNFSDWNVKDFYEKKLGY